MHTAMRHALLMGIAVCEGQMAYMCVKYTLADPCARVWCSFETLCMVISCLVVPRQMWCSKSYECEPSQGSDSCCWGYSVQIVISVQAAGLRIVMHCRPRARLIGSVEG